LNIVVNRKVLAAWLMDSHDINTIMSLTYFQVLSEREVTII
jgi:hypothetical protein